MQTLTGAQILIELIKRQGIDTLSGIPGGSNLPIYDALARTRGLRHVLARHEQGAGFIAQGMARQSGRPAVCLVTSGPGATNVLTALADARHDAVPVVCISGQVPSAMIGTQAFQEADICSMARPVVKHAWQVREASELLDVIPAAFALAAEGRPGPVLVDIPKDVQLQSVQVTSWPEPGKATAPPSPPALALAEAAAMINQARRPVLYLGGGVRASGAEALAAQLAERAKLPTVTTLMGLGSLGAGHPLNLGMLGMHARPSANHALERCDLLIAIGARFDDRATGRLEAFCPEARVVHIDIEAAQLGRLRTAHVGIVADAREALTGLLPLVAASERPAWLAEVDALRANDPAESSDDVRTGPGLIRQLGRMLEPETILTTDVGQHQMWVAQHFPFGPQTGWQTSGGMGTMGFGLPAALGAALSAPERPVVCVSGDGSLLMNMQELATAAEERLDIKLVLLNNRSLGLVRQQQTLFYEGRLAASDFGLDVDFEKIAGAFGWRYFNLGKGNDPVETLARGLAASGPCFIEAPIAAEQLALPMVPPGAANTTMIVEEPEPCKSRI